MLVRGALDGIPLGAEIKIAVVSCYLDRVCTNQEHAPFDALASYATLCNLKFSFCGRPLSLLDVWMNLQSGSACTPGLLCATK